MAAICRFWPFRAHRLPIDRAAWLSCSVIIVIKGTQNVILAKRKLGEHGSDLHFRPFRAHMLPIGRAAWLLGFMKLNYRALNL